MSKINYILIAVLLGVVGQLLVKRGLNLLGEIDFSRGLFASYLKIFTSPVVIIGTLSYTSSIFFWLYALSKVNLSFAYPILALSYVLVVIASRLFLGEDISLLRWVGVGVICFGVFLISRS